MNRSISGKNIRIIVLTLLLIPTVLFMFLFKHKEGRILGTGTEGDPFTIASCAELQAVNSNLASYYLLTDNVDCNGYGFSPLGGAVGTPFTGTIWGDGYSVLDLSLTVGSAATGLFGYTDNATITDLNLVNFSFSKLAADPLDGAMGGLVAYAQNTTITNCTAYGTISEPFRGYDDYTKVVGGLVGQASGTTDITNSSSDVVITLLTYAYKVGGLVGLSIGSANISNSHTTAVIHTGIESYDIGGFIGWQAENSTIDNSYAEGEVHVSYGADVGEGDSYGAGGFAGSINGLFSYSGTTTTSFCHTSVDVLVDGINNWLAAGFVGTAYENSTITNSYAEGDVTVLSEEIWSYNYGGFVGLTRNRYGGTDPIISKSYSTGTVTVGNGEAYVGGFVGEHRDGYIGDSYSRSPITAGDEVQTLGGFVGYINQFTQPATLENCYATGLITGSMRDGTVGGLVGLTFGSPTITSSYWDTETTTIAISDGGEGRTTAQMLTQGNYIGWNFSGVWYIDALYNDGYPILADFLPTPTPTEIPTDTPTEAPTNTPTEIPTETPTDTPTNTPVPSDTPLPTNTFTPTPTRTPVPAPTNTPVPVATNTPSPSNTPGPSPTTGPLSVSDTPTPTITISVTTTVSVAVSVTITGTISTTPTINSSITPSISTTPSRTPTHTVRPTATLIPSCLADPTQLRCSSTLPETGDYQGFFALPSGTNAMPVAGALISTTIAASTATLAYPNLIQYGFIWITKRKTGRKWGIVYDAVTSFPVPFTMIRAINTVTNQQAKFTVSDTQGKYGFVLDMGNYLLKAECSGYEPFEKEVTLGDSEQLVALDIPLSKKIVSNKLTEIKEKITQIIRPLSIGLTVFGFLLTLIAIMMSFSLLNVLILAAYIFQAVILYGIREPRGWGIIQGPDNTGLQGAFVRLFDITQGRQVDVQITDIKGRFGFMLPESKNEYQIRVDKPGYKFTGKDGAGFIPVDKRALMNMDVQLEVV